MRAWLHCIGVVVIGCGAGSGASAPPSNPPPNSPPWNANAFAAIQPRYMQALDDRVADRTAAAVAIEAEIAAQVERAIRADEASQLRTDADRASAGLALIYGALLLVRDVWLVEQQRIDANRLYATHRYSSASTDAAEGAARRQLAVELLRHAQRLRPNDGRIASWLAGAVAVATSGPGNTLTDGAKAQLLAAIDVEPTFNLWTAFVAMRDEPIGSPHAAALFVKTNAFMDSRTCRDITPGSADAHNCTSGPLAPFNGQAAIVMLADQYLHHGEHALRQGDVPRAMPLLGMARGILATLEDEQHRDVTARWPNVPLVKARVQRLDALRPGQPVPDPSFWKSVEYEAMYDCASCHVQ